ncbi:MBL fold metallo-hydrolase [Rhizobium sullae]|uniref:MBL fold metallo-hydrolase n=1 Tax=Rhizobium sullae TaxID=50338 RepID=A0A2N0D0C0_RHISU|nr:MBL fold metallo-hydrolase [Rhizobium sullae]PKA39492.1 MBL fold metallo-hydrolase [Rhizobium sullae]
MSNPGAFYNLKHGTFDITVLSDGPIVLGGEIFAPEGSDSERENIVSRLGGAENTADAQSNIPLIVTSEDTILVDVGAGRLFQPGEGQLEANLNSVGVNARDVTKVVISHAHPDHIWGMLREDGTLRFPNAHFYVSRDEWDFWTGEKARELPDAVQPFVAGARRDLTAIANHVTFVGDGDEVVPGLRVLSTPGHTPGHISLVLDGEAPLIITVDATASQIVSFEHPDWSFGFDMDPEQARITRRALLERAAKDNATLIGYHWSYPGVGSVRKEGETFKFSPVEEVQS